MHDPRLTALFERYREQGDLSSLAKLFDAISPEMMRVARHVAGRGVDPEDVVQSTFLASIERADAFDPSRPIVPWLMGILINQARLMNRRRATRHEEAAAEDLASGTNEPDDAEAHEVRDAVARALAGLPDTYREVLVAHLAEGKPPHEIARDLGRPQGTVRAQLHRGLRLVRRSLPAGFAFGVMAMLDRTALANVRHDVLAAAARAKSLPPSAIPAAAPTSKIGLGVAAASVVLAAVVGLAWLGGGSARADQELASADADGEVQRVAAGYVAPEDRGRAVAAPDAVAVAPDTAPDAAAPVQVGSVRVVVTDALGEPVPGVRLDLLAWGDPLWHERVRALVTDANGVGAFEQVAAGRVGVHTDGGGTQSRADVLPGKCSEITIKLERGLDLAGVVHDERGMPLAGAVVEAGEHPGDAPRRAAAPTGADGRYVLRDVARAPCGWARAAGRPASETLTFATPTWLRATDAALDFVLPAPVEPLEFAVVGPRGTPIAGALAVALSHGVAGPEFRTDGALVLPDRAARTASSALGVVRLAFDRARADRIVVSAAGYAPRTIALADVGSLVVLAPGATLAGVARFTDGVAAEGAVVEARYDDAGEPLFARSGPDGTWEIVDAPAGSFTLRAQASRDAFVEETRGVARAGETTRWNPTLRHMTVIRGVARSAHGGVAKTWLVKAVREDSADFPLLAAWTRSRSDPWSGPDLRQCWTGEDGAFTVPCAAGATYRLELRARMAWNGQVHGSLNGVRAGASDVDLRVQGERGFVRARLVDAQGLPIAGTLGVIHTSSGAEHSGDAQPDGRVERDLHPGTYQLVVWPKGGAPRSLGTRAVGADEVVDLGDVRVDAGGSLRIAGAGGLIVRLRGPDGLPYHLTRSGRDLVAAGLPPGTYVAWGTEADGRQHELAAHVVSGSETVLAFEGAR